MGLDVSWRPGKTTASIIAKLRRQTTKLSQMQDIAGCRIIVDNPWDQDKRTARLTNAFEQWRLYDRRKSPSFGYRAIHIVVTSDAKPVELQVRTTLQHLWAQMAEKLADKMGQELKYGGGPADIRELLDSCSRWIQLVEEGEELRHSLANAYTQRARLGLMHDDELRASLQELEANDRRNREEVIEYFASLSRELPGK